jgi:L-ascorbate metabolism protein UlaG (beta-lactamase superfamily)
MKRRTALKLTGTAVATLLKTNSSVLAQSQRIDNQYVKPKSDNMKIQYLGWAGIKIEVGETTLLLDATAEENVLATVDTPHRHALITHHHGDHYDHDLLKSLFDKNSVLACHQDVLPWINGADIRTQTVKTYEPIILSRRNKDIMAIAVPAVDGFGHPQFSWIVEGGGKKIIHCGDTLWHGHFWDISRVYGPFDMAFMPINGARQNLGRYTDEGVPAVLTPMQAVAAAKILNAKTVCPIHYGGETANYFEVPHPEATFLTEAKAKNIKPLVLKPGEWVKWEE